MYATLTVVRNEEEMIGPAIRSVMNQSITPGYMVVVNDGSTDGTASILRSLKNPLLYVLTRKDRGYSALGTYIMADIYNTGLSLLAKLSNWQYLVIVPGDLLLDYNHVEKVIAGMDNKTGIAGGIARNLPFDRDYNRDHVIGAGRIIRREILQYMDYRLPRNYDWESSVLHCATFLGLEIKRMNDCFFTMRRGGKGHAIDYTGWGRGMKNANYHPLVALGRVLKEALLRKNFSRAVKMLAGYLAEPASDDYPDYSLFLREQQKQRIINVLFRSRA